MKKTIGLPFAVVLLSAGLASAQPSGGPKPGPMAIAPTPYAPATLSWGGELQEVPAPQPAPSAPSALKPGQASAAVSPYTRTPLLPPSGQAPCPLPSCTTPTDPAAPGRIWASAEYLLWWTKDSRLPPLVTGGAPGAGAILGPGTGVLFGGSRLDQDPQSGGRFFLGGWLNPARTLGVEASYLFLGTVSTDFQAGANGGPGTPAIGRPFYDASRNAENSQLVAFPGLVGGRVLATVSTRLQGWEGNGVCNLYRSPTVEVDGLFGFRYLELVEGLGIGEDLTVLPGNPFIGGSAFRVLDDFATSNRFYGGQLGLRGFIRRGNWSLSGTAKVALGDSHQVVGINGSTLIVPAAGSGLGGGLQPGGLLALPSNIGRYQRDQFAVVPEVTVKVGYWLTRSIRATIGYTFLYYSAVARPGDQVNRVVNPGLLPVNQPTGPVAGPAQPNFVFHGSDFWAQGLNLGLELRY